MEKRRNFGKWTVALLAIAAVWMPVSAQAEKTKLSIPGCIISKGDRIDIDVMGGKESRGKYRTSDTKVASVSRDGVVRAKNEGIAQISWTKGKKRYVSGIIVTKAPTISRNRITVQEGKRKKVSVSRFENFGLKVTWNSLNPEIAAVKNGKILGVSKGATVIVVKIKGYTKTYKKHIVVSVVKAPETTLPAEDSQEQQNGTNETEHNDAIAPDHIDHNGMTIVTDGGIHNENLPATGASIVTGSSIITITGGSIVTGSGIEEENGNPGNVNTSHNGTGNDGNGTMPEDGNNGNLSTGSSIVSGETGKTDTGNEEHTGNAGTEGNGNSDTANSGADHGNGENPNNPEQSGSQNPAAKSMAEQVTELVNKERAKKGVSGLTLDIKLTACADLRAEELLDTFSHTRPDGTNCFTILDENGMAYTVCAENIAMGQKTAEQVMESWMNSSGHKGNILNAGFKKLGVGYFQLGGTVYWVQLFTD